MHYGCWHCLFSPLACHPRELSRDDGHRLLRVRASGATLIVGATVVAGVAGYGVTWLVAAVLGPADYKGFAVFWAALYLVVGSLAGLQQEVARGTRRGHDSAGSGRANVWAFGAYFAAGLFVLLIAVSPAWVPSVLGTSSLNAGAALAVGACAYILVGVVCGVLYGLQSWTLVALMIVIDGVMRLILVALALLAGWGAMELEWAAAAPFALTPLIMWVYLRRAVRGAFALDVGYRMLTWNVSRTVLAAAATSTLVSGFPLVLGATSQNETSAAVGALILAVTLTRAPLVVTFLALQSYLVVHFKARIEDNPDIRGHLAFISAAVIVATTVLSLGAWAVGEFVLVHLFGPGYAIDGAILALLVASSGLIAMLSVSGAVLLARSHHGWFTFGWVCAALATVAVMFFPLGLYERTILALAIGPACGLIVHFATMVGRRYGD